MFLFGKRSAAEFDSPNVSFPLHRAAFSNNVKAMEMLIKSGYDINEQDPHGNTALHIAVMLGHKETINALLNFNPSVRIQNNDGWNSLLESVSFGNRETISTLLFTSKMQSYDMMTSRKPHLIKVLKSIGDFYLELKWDFHTWIPLLSKILPSDTCKIHKQDCALRMDTTLIDFNNRSWQRGDISFLFNPESDNSRNHLIVMDNKKKVFQRIRPDVKTSYLNEQVDTMMSNDIVSMHCSTKPINFIRSMSGWIFKQEKSDDIAGYTSNYYIVEGLSLISKKRREHLSVEDVKKNKALVQEFASGAFGKHLDNEDSYGSRKSLIPPTKPNVTFDEYLNGATNGYLGRPRIQKEGSKEFKAIIAMSEDFPLSVDVLVDILEIISPFKHINKLHQFCKARLPPGFPVKLEIPLLATISAKVTFQKFEWRNDLTPKFFTVPRDYVEDSCRFVNL